MATKYEVQNVYTGDVVYTSNSYDDCVTFMYEMGYDLECEVLEV